VSEKRVIPSTRAVAAALLIAPLLLAFPAAAQQEQSGSSMPGPMPDAAMQNAAPGAVTQEMTPGGASGFIAKLGKEGLQVLGPSVPQTQRAARFRQLFQDDFDLAGISRFVLGPQGRQMSPDAQHEFQGVFREFLVQSYSAKLGPYGGSPFHVTGERRAGDEMVVTSQVARQGGAPVAIDWHVVNRNGRMLITDVDVDGVSMKAAQREQFAQIIQRNGGRAEALVAVLRQQLAQAPQAR